jgi:hypothetical protein
MKRFFPLFYICEICFPIQGTTYFEGRKNSEEEYPDQTENK